jgi:hypothetical protein
MSSAPARPTRVALEQLAVTAGAVEDNRALGLARSRAALSDGADIVVLPELVVPGYLVDPHAIAKVAEPVDGPSVASFSEIAGDRGGLIAFGFAERAGTDYFNSVVLRFEIPAERALRRGFLVSGRRGRGCLSNLAPPLGMSARAVPRRRTN